MKAFEIWPQFGKHSLFQVHQVLVNQDLQRWQEELTSLTARNSILSTAQRQKMKDIYFIDSEYKAQTILMTSMQHHLIPGVLKRI